MHILGQQHTLLGQSAPRHRVDVLARLSPPLLSQLRAALRHEHSLAVADDWRVLTRAVRRQPVDVAVVDPRADGVLRTGELRALLLMHPSLPVLMYSSLSAETVHVTAELAPLGLQHVVLRTFDDDALRLRELLERMVVYGVADELLMRLSSRLAEGPVVLGRAVERLFREPQHFGSVNDLAAAADLTRRSLDRWLERQGVASARVLIAVARLARAYHYLRDPGYMAEDVARKMGYASPRLFASQTREATGLNPSVLRQELSQDIFTERLAALLFGERPENGHDVRSGKAHTGRR